MGMFFLTIGLEKFKYYIRGKTRPAWAGFKTAEEGRAKNV